MNENKKTILYFIIYMLTVTFIWACYRLHYYVNYFHDYDSRLFYYKYTLQKEKAKQCEVHCINCPKRKFNYDTGKCLILKIDEKGK